MLLQKVSCKPGTFMSIGVYRFVDSTTLQTGSSFVSFSSAFGLFCGFVFIFAHLFSPMPLTCRKYGRSARARRKTKAWRSPTCHPNEEDCGSRTSRKKSLPTQKGLPKSKLIRPKLGQTTGPSVNFVTISTCLLPTSHPTFPP